MEDKTPYDLISKFLAGACSNSEKDELQKWKDESNEHAKLFEQMKTTWNAGTPPTYTANTEEALNKVNAIIGDEKTIRFPTLRLAIAGAAAILILFGLLTYLKSDRNPQEIVIATLLQAKPSAHVLPDGSTVTLNGGSMLSYPKVFKGDERRVGFKGEAYFAIQSDASKPFIIESGGAETRVVGTEFNLRAKSDSVVQVYVTEGKVALSVRESELKEIYIEPGQVGSYKVNKAVAMLEISENRDKNFLSWKNGVLSFEQELLKDALPQIAELYGIDLVIGDSSLVNMEFTAAFDSLTVSELTQSLELLLDVEIQQDGNVFTLN